VPSLGHVKDNPQNGEKESDNEMNKKILSSIMIIAFAAGLLGAGTIAYFNSTATVGTVVFTTGTVKIAIENPWTNPVNIADMKPCYTYHTEFNITNVGSDPANVYKEINVTIDSKSIAQYILYDLWVEVYVKINDKWTLFWHQGIYDETVTIHDVDAKWIYLGMLPVDAKMKVIQSYHMKADTGNDAQGATMSMDIAVKGEQLIGTLQLENKDTTDAKYLILHDGYGGTLTYDMVGATFKYTFTGTAPLAGTEYYLIYYADPWAGNNPGAYLGKGTTDGSGNIAISGSVDTGSLPNVADGNYNYGAKIWLVTGADYNSHTAVTGPMTGWNPANYLFETGLITYTKG